MEAERAFEIFMAEHTEEDQKLILLEAFGQICEYMKQYEGKFKRLFRIKVEARDNGLIQFVVLPQGFYVSYQGVAVMDNSGCSYLYSTTIYQTNKTIEEIKDNSEVRYMRRYIEIPMLFYAVFRWKAVKAEIEQRLKDMGELNYYFDTFIA